jgi:hypothetical protein
MVASRRIVLDIDDSKWRLRASSGLATSKWVWADQPPAVALKSLAALVVGQRSAEMLDHLFEVLAGGRGGVEEQYATGFAAAVLPGMWDVTRKKCAGAWSANAHLVSNLEGELGRS